METFWLPLLATIIGGLVVWWVIRLILQSRKKHRENVIYKFLKNNTVDKGGEQFLKIDFVSKELAIQPMEIKAVVENSSRIFFHPNDNQKVGIYDLKSVYEDRGIVVV
jgi:hypothetical protein